MQVKEIAFVVYPVVDLGKARGFYEGVLGLTESRHFGTEEKGMIEYDLGACTLAIGNSVDVFKPSSGGGCVALEVENFDEAVAEFAQHGCPVLIPPFETPVCHIVVVSDPDGNSVLIHRAKSETGGD